MQNSDQTVKNSPTNGSREHRTSRNADSQQVPQTQSNTSFTQGTTASSTSALDNKILKAPVSPDCSVKKTEASEQGKPPEATPSRTGKGVAVTDTRCSKSEDNAQKCNRKSFTNYQPKINKDIKKVDTADDGKATEKKPELLSIPQTNFAIGLMVMICFNPPFGLLALYFSLRAAAAYRDGDKVSGAWRARTSIVISLIGIMLSMVIISSLVLYIAVNKHSTRKSYRLRSSTNLGF